MKQNLTPPHSLSVPKITRSSNKVNTGEGHYVHVRTHNIYWGSSWVNDTRLHTMSIAIISIITAWLPARGYLFLFQIMNFLAKLPHAYNYFLQLSAFPQQLAAAQIMFALNTAQRLRHSFVELQKGGDLRLRKWVWAFELHFCFHTVLNRWAVLSHRVHASASGRHRSTTADGGRVSSFKRN